MIGVKRFRGDGFQNRYRISGTLTTLSPLHIGTGEERPGDDKKKTKGNGDPSLVSTVIKDFQGKPVIPGSALRGVMRHWLLSVLAGVNSDWAADRNYENKAFSVLDQKAQLEMVKDEFSWLELLFGTPFHAGKIEVWDAACETKTLTLQPPDDLLTWNPASLTYIDTSVAIDPVTGTALEHLLYNSEVVAPGVVFSFNLVGQNLGDEELGMILLALQGFNSAIYPIQVGARTGRGYGRVVFEPGPIYCLDTGSVETWVSDTLRGFRSYRLSSKDKVQAEPEAGYFNLPVLGEEEQAALVERAKAALIDGMKPAVTNSVGG
ncbi:MAG: hypothetical protein KBG20_13475 [Caldilineaceae bacterium]|nr:hypothetical protein [Caldilineaceae bacterium]MBP8123419.1 hypothetical protein [Caldilineaceae bacterium]MBP9073309.1 hypothetical protein [Caldilineaceae bacterium]